MDLIRDVYNHLVLPPKLPETADKDADAISRELLGRLMHACRTLEAFADPTAADALDNLCVSLHSCSILNRGRLEKQVLLEHFQQLEHNHTLILHVVEQNAGLIVRRETQSSQDWIIFEAFEASPSSAQVLAAENALLWTFPGRSARIPAAKLDEAFLDSLTTFLEQASMESIVSLQAQSQKANVAVEELRDTTDPALITQMLMPLLEAVGEHADVAPTRKRIRDDVNFSRDLPWRRSPFWLILRVAAQRHLSRAIPDGRLSYKLVMCILLAQFLKSVTPVIDPNLAIMLRAKLCRRMAKIEMEKNGFSPARQRTWDCLLAHVTPLVKASVEQCSAYVEDSWLSFKRNAARRVPRLPTRASPNALKLSLTHSGKHLDQLLTDESSATTQPILSHGFPEMLDKAVLQGKEFTDRVFQLALLESEIEHGTRSTPSNSHAAATRCRELAQEIHHYFQEVGSIYDSDPLQISTMLLHLFDLYARMDACAVVACPLLRDYRPVFPPELLDTLLLLPTSSSMARLQQIQNYLDLRVSTAMHDHILCDANDTSAFAARYVSSSGEMQDLMARIEVRCRANREAKEAEWRQAVAEYDRLTEAIERSTCTCTWRDGQRSVSGCDKCWHWRSRKRIKTEINEELLPSQPVPRATVLLELAMPKFLSEYRNATWRILRAISHPDQTDKTPAPNAWLRECRPLKKFTASSMDGVSLASIKKCFQETHYKFTKAKIPLERVLLPFAAQFELFDSDTQTWVKDIKVPPSLHHICGVHLPLGLETFIRPKNKVISSDNEGLSSYEIQANQTECPSHMAGPEFSAYQKVLSGTLRRWRNILVELGASNINFSNTDATQMLIHLSMQAGPRLQDDSLRAVHSVFREPDFLEALADQIEKRLIPIMKNWRETSCMELLINLCLKMLSLCPPTMERRLSLLLLSCRRATLNWITSLQQASVGPQEGEATAQARNGETSDSFTDSDAADRMATYAFKAALLCRLTFESLVETQSELSSEDLVSWVQASVALQENLVHQIDKLPQTIRRMMIRDAKMAFHLQLSLRMALLAHPSCIGEGIGRGCGDAVDPAKATRQFSSWEFLESPYSRWANATMTDRIGGVCHTISVHFNLVEGHLLYAGKPRGKLPVEIRSDADVQQLFGNRHLFTYTSSLPHMTHRLATPINDQEIHFGKRHDSIVIRAVRQDQMLEFIPRRRFLGAAGFDLPSSLLENCAHWLDLKTGVLEIRRERFILKPRDWLLDVRQRNASRGTTSGLVDPQSEEFRAISVIFRHFVDPFKLTVFQPSSEKGRLSVEMKHLDLLFFVTSRGLLFSHELKAEIDPNQDLGTWYGLESKVVLRDTVDWTKRSVIIPLGQPLSQCRGMHASVLMRGDEYGKFEVDDILGRLTCAPEPRLIYTKALCHALTSFCLADPLTKRTGTEEAFHILRSAAAQPWAPLDRSHEVLENMAENMARLLMPQREYYPKNLQRLQKVIWNEHVPSAVQHDSFQFIIDNIMSKSDRLARFSKTAPAEGGSDRHSTHLRKRGEIRRRLYERPSLDTSTYGASDTVYLSRDKVVTDRARRVHEIASMIQLSDGFQFRDRKRLTEILESSDLIGGFHYEVPLPNSISLVNQIEDPVTTRLGDLVSFCRSAASKGPPTFCLSLLAFGPRPVMDLIMLLAGFSCIDQLRNLALPFAASFADFKSRGCPSADVVQRQIASAYYELPCSPGDEETFGWAIAEQKHERACEKEGRKLSQLILKQWPNLDEDGLANGWGPRLIDMEKVIWTIDLDWHRRQQNDRLARFIDDAQSVLDALGISRLPARLHQSKHAHAPPPPSLERNIIPSLSQDLVVKSGPELLPPNAVLPVNAFVGVPRGPRGLKKNQELPEIRELATVLERFKASSSTIMRQQYSNDLLESLIAYRRSGDAFQPQSEDIPEPESLREAIKMVSGLVSSQLQTLTLSFASNDSRYNWLQLGGLWPDLGPIGVLELLRSKSDFQYGVGMKEALVVFGCTITRLQQLRRIKAALENHEERIVVDELRNRGHENWDPVKLPDVLLLEIESDILVRPEQVDAARAIMYPASKENSVFQMNMGKGKTSVILPIAAALLADGKRLVRLIVPKPLLLQTAQIIQSRLGGLIGKEISHIPFSRQTPTTPEMTDLYCQLHMDMFNAKGVILTSHENVLSYKLSGLQRLADDKLGQASQMIDFQTWIETNCRDVLDESDFTLAVKTQLNYPSGSEMPVDGHPFRWQVIEELLSMVAHVVPELRQRFRRSIEILGRPGWFPMMQFLKTDVMDEIHNYLVEKICSGQASFLRPAMPITPSQRSAIREVLCRHLFDSKLYREVIAFYPHPESAAKQLLIVRGLITHNIIPTCLAKRWNIQYGLRAGGYPVAVPYESRNSPSERAEWGHPDVAIIFTCLSFYYSGVNLAQFRQGLHHVLTCEDPASQYERWISQCDSLPEALHHWNVINLEDEEQTRELWTHLHKTQTVVNHYLNTFVFPVHAKQFSVKLQASSWDIPLLSGPTKGGVKTTGFSGTNDSLLPRTIKQDDLPHLKQTNAEVLSYLLQRRNRRYELAADPNGKRLSEEGLLKELTQKQIRIFIDAGAYVIEMSNKTLARLWLTIDTEAKAAVYFGEDNRAWVMFRDRSKPDAPLLTTPFVNRLGECVVYLDEAHTRGVDLKFDSIATAALTLSLKQTKDFTVQAAMRLRQLKTTQSVVFFAPPEVDGSIRDLCRRNFAYKLDSSDVVYWLLEQTCRTNEDVYGLHVAQGLDFCKRQDARLRYPDFMTDKTSRAELLDILREPEHQTLEKLYGGASGSRQLQSLGQLHTPQLQSLSDTLFRESATISPALIGAFDEVEQEREVELQLESVREVQKPVRYKPLTFPGLHKEILRFAQTGTLRPDWAGFEHAFSYLGRTEIGTKFDVKQTGSRFYVSAEFRRTVVLAKGNEKAFNIFLRPVEWILWSPSTETALVIIPEEAEQLLIKLLDGAKELEKMAVHLIAYSAPVTRSMTAFNTFRYYSLPPLPQDAVFPDWFRNEVGILAGRLYIDYSEWSSVTRYLHPNGESSDPEGGETDAPGALQPFTSKPVDFLLEWLGSGRKAQDVLSTPVGFICMRRTVSEDHPFFLANKSMGRLENGSGEDCPEESDAVDGEGEEELCRLRDRCEQQVDKEDEVSTEWSDSFGDESSRVLDEEDFDLARSDEEFAD